MSPIHSPDKVPFGFADEPRPSKWSKTYWSDLGERVLATEIGALLTTSALMGGTAVSWSNGQAVWTLLGAPPAIAFLKGLLANLADPESGPSLLPSPPAPPVPEAPVD